MTVAWSPVFGGDAEEEEEEDEEAEDDEDEDEEEEEEEEEELLLELLELREWGFRWTTSGGCSSRSTSFSTGLGGLQKGKEKRYH